MKNVLKFSAALVIAALFAGCASESSRVVETPKVASYGSVYNGKKVSVSIGRFNNQSAYQNGAFSQAQSILITNLQQSGRFSVLERSNMSVLKQESELSKEAQNLKGSRYVITGDVTEFGRKTTGDHQLFGILGKGKKQTAYSKVNLNVVDTKTAEVVYSVSGAGEYTLSNREIIGFGGTAGYDSTLNGKVLSLAIVEAVNNLVNGIESGAWQVK